MVQISIKIQDKAGHTKAVERGSREVNLVYSGAYREGDKIVFEISEKNTLYWMSLDDAKGSSLVYLTGNVEYVIPFGEKRVNLSPKVFSGEKHLVRLKKAEEFEDRNYRNLAFNVNDQHGEVQCYPHASANVETRGESVFAAMNAIDGVTAAKCHGEWPYESWGINRNPEAVLRLDFGRPVCVDRIVLYTRADYPHDNWWKEACVTFSDGGSETLQLVKTGEAQAFSFVQREISWLELGKLIQSDEPSPFPALVQIEVYGTDKETGE